MEWIMATILVLGVAITFVVVWGVLADVLDDAVAGLGITVCLVILIVLVRYSVFKTPAEKLPAEAPQVQTNG